MLTLQEKLDIIERTNSLGELPLDAMPYTQNDEYYFVSYSHADYKQVYSDILKLQAAGINVWYDRGLPAGKNWEEMAEEALTKYSCVGVIFYVSKNSLLSDAVAREIAYVKNLGKDFLSVNLPITCEDGSEMICSAQQMLSILEKQNPISEGKREEVCSAFGDKVIYLGYNESTELKAEKIKLLKRPALFEFELTDREYDEDFSLSVLTLKSVNSIDVKHVEVPLRAMIDGEECAVMKIGDCAFANCKNLKSIKLPDEVEIGKSAFLGCTSLEKIQAERISDIEDNAFFGCGSLKEVPILDGWVKSNAFCGCASLEEITLGNGFHSCSPNLFSGSGIKWVTREEQEESYTYMRSYSFSCYGDELTTTDGCADADTQKSASLLYGRPLSDGSFKHSSFVKKIIGGFLPDANAIKFLEVGKDVNTIDAYALYRCQNLSEVTFLKSDADSLYINEKAFCKTQSLKALTLPRRTKYIGVSAFERSGLELLSFEADAELTQIDDKAFKNCKKLLAAEFPTALERIGRSAFEDCDSLKRIELPEGLRVIEKKAFADCDGLCEVIFSEGIVKIGDNAFCGNRNLTSISLPSSLKEIGANAFYQCPNLKSVVLREGLSKIGICAFSNTGIEKITLPKSLEKISVTAIDEIKDITFMGTMERWQELLLTGQGRLRTPVKCIDGIYDENTALKGNLRYELNSDGLGYTLTGIGSYVATRLTVPKSHKGLPVTDIAARALDGSSVKSLSFEGAPKIANGAFNGAFFLESVDLNNVRKLGEGAFSGASNLKSVTVGTALEEIPDFCFSLCRRLESVYITENVKRIGKGAFAYCAELADVRIENGVEVIGDLAFSDCKSLKSIFIPSSVTVMGENSGGVFLDCSPSLVIDCEADAQPDGWVEGWNKTFGEDPDCKPMEYKANFAKKRQ